MPTPETSEGQQFTATPSISVSGITIEWDVRHGTCSFDGHPVAMMWIDTTLAGLMAAVRKMVGTDRFALALQSEGRLSVEADWQVISRFATFEEGFRAIANAAAVGGWGQWRLVSLDAGSREGRFQVVGSWEGRFQRAIGECWGSGMLAGKLAGYVSRLFSTNCWADQTAFVAKGDPFDEFVVRPSERTIEAAIDDLLLSDRATRADMAVALKRLQDEVVVRERAEEALRASEGRARALLAALPDMMFRLSRDGVFIDFQADPADLYADADRLIGSRLEDVFPPEFVGRVRAMTAETLRSTTLQVFEYEMETTARGLGYYEARMVVSGADEVTAIVRDITARKRAEAEKVDLEANLAQAQRMESIGRLAGGVAHDFNNLLAVQLGYCELLAAKLQPDDPVAEGLAEIRACAERAASLTRQLLAFSRKQVLRPTEFDVNGLVAGVDRLLRRLIGEDVRLVTTTSPGPAVVKADTGQLEQVLINLAANARDAMPRGGRLLIEASTVLLDEVVAREMEGASPGPYVVLAVSDTGRGMDDRTRHQIFEPFFTTKGRAQGTGLGLATVYGIVRQSGGFIKVYSEVDLGTTFRIYLPQVQGPSASRPDVGASAPAGGGELILLVEDDAQLRRLAELLLRQLGYDVASADNAAAAFALVEEGMRPDLVITDVVMPDASGPVLVGRLRNVMPAVKALYMSGYTDDAIVHHGALEPGIVFLQKPFTSQSLAQRIREALAT